VEWQLRIADGEKIPLAQKQIKQTGHAIEVRLYAENPDKDFLPITGHIEQFIVPDEPWVRVDTGVRGGDDISIFYDPMIAKIIVEGRDRGEAIKRLRHTLARTAVFGLTTNLPLLRGIARHPGFAKGDFDTSFIERELKSLLHRPEITPEVITAALVRQRHNSYNPPGDPWQDDGWRLAGSCGQRLLLRDEHGNEEPLRVFAAQGGAFRFERGEITCESAAPSADSCVLNQDNSFQVAIDDQAFVFTLISAFAPHTAAVADTATHPVSPMPGRIVAVHVKDGDAVKVGQALLVLEGMKMEYTVKAGVDGTIEKLLYAEGDMVDAEAPLINIEASE
ncbi:MAG: biotin/lipoyl-binding protein, partial [Sinobacteraceae bacterium]|nr:biotin/lipoyl-binding protein [Nevskiaceae bacterium]